MSGRRPYMILDCLVDVIVMLGDIQITPWSTSLEKLRVTQLLEEFTAFCGTEYLLSFVIFLFLTRTVHRLIFCTVTNKCTIISQIITLLHVLTLLCHPQGTCS
jgi:hypothetical protein